MSSEVDDIHDPPPPYAGSIFVPLAICVASLVIYMITDDPATAAMTICIKFGWEDFRTAYWLKRTDPDSGRGSACCWIYVASGLWATAVTGVGMAVLTLLLMNVFKIGNAVFGALATIHELLGGTGLMIVLGFVFSTFATYIALAYSHRHGVRPWLNSGVHIARRQDQWPPLYGYNNRIMVLVVTTLIVTFLLLVPALLRFAAMILWPVVARQYYNGLMLVLIGTCYLVMLPTAIVVVANLRRRRFFATHPADCWGRAPLPAKDKVDFERER